MSQPKYTETMSKCWHWVLSLFYHQTWPIVSVWPHSPSVSQAGPNWHPPKSLKFLMGKYVCPSGFSKSSHIPSRHFHRFSRLHHGTCWHFTVLILMSSSVLAVVSTVLRQQPLSQYCFTCIETMAVIFSLINSKTCWKRTGGIRSAWGANSLPPKRKEKKRQS